MMDPVYTEHLRLGRLGDVRIDVDSEHHQGAQSVEMLLPFAVNGTRRFRSTNGTAWRTSDGSFLCLHDATVLLRIDLDQLTVEHLIPPENEYFAEIEETTSGYRARVYTGDGGSRWIAIENEPGMFQPGPGPVVDGKFPSAFPP